MKKVVLCLLLLGFISAGHSQILLKEAKVDSRPETMKIDPNTNSLVVQLPEKYAGEFQKDPLEFMKKNFNIQKFIAANQNSKYDNYMVTFKSRKGSLEAWLDKNGHLVYSVQRFKDVRLPENARLQILAKYRDAAIVSNKYYASTKGWDIHKAHFKIKVKEGDKTRRLQINKDRELLSLTGI